MILDAGELVAGYPFVARRHGRVSLCDVAAVGACCDTARALAGGALADEPAAMFYAFAAKRRAFPFAWKLMAELIARSQATANGLAVEATGDELAALAADVLYQRAAGPDVRAWFAARQHPVSR